MDHSNNSLKYARVEEERRFLLSDFPADLDSDSHFVRIIDNYIDGTRLRLRRIESPEGKVGVYKLGQKYKSPELKAHETIMTNIYLNKAEYRTFEYLPGSSLIKRRYSYQHEGFDYSLDRFEGHLEGLLMAEIESRGNIDLTQLPVPDFALREVTDDPFYSGSHIAKITQPEFQHWLTSQ